MSSPWRRKQLLRRFYKNLFLLFLILLVGGSLFSLSAFAWVSRDLPDPNALSNREVAQSTKIYDRTGEHLLYEIHGGENRTLVKLEEIPDAVKWATISVEDQQFYKHNGFNPVRIVEGLVLGTLLHGRPQGGSTITQQLVKNAILTGERTFTRKIKELLLAVAIEQHFTKDQILQLYLNEIPYGSTNYGVEAASQAYFGKSVRDLDLAQAATLAALPKAPTRYLNDPQALDNRRDTVLELMFGQGYITRQQADAAQAEDVTLVDAPDSGIVAPHFVFYVKEQLVDDFTERTVEQGGLKVITTLDYDKQMAAEEAVKAGVEAKGTAYGFNNAALVSLDPRSGEILAMVGSKDYFDKDIDGAVNVTLRPRQPGSSIKPVVYTAGFLKGYTPNTILYDVVTTFKTEIADYTPHDYHADVEFGPVTVRKALQGSLNIPAVQMLYLVGVQNFVTFAQSLGYSTFADRSRFGLSLVLGGGEVTLLEHTAAYGEFATEGMKHDLFSIQSVEGPTGEKLYEHTASEGTRVVDENTARMTSNVLSDNASRAYIFGEVNHLTLPDRAVAVKTGTTNNYHDAWTVGYTPSLVAGVWVGNNNNDSMTRGADGSVVAAPIWNAYMQKALVGTAPEAFTAPEIPVRGKAILDGQLPSTTVVIDRASGKLATDRTPDTYRQEVACGEYHSILHYVDVNDPLGDPPSDPSTNPQYTNWEAAITAWMERENIKATDGAKLARCNVPTESDDVHVAANEPSITITSPENHASIDGRTATVLINASAPRGVSSVEYAIDGKFVASSTSSTGTTMALPSWVDAGSHTLTATAFDDVDNSSFDEITMNVTTAPNYVAVSVTNPLNGQTIKKSQNHFTVVVELDDVTTAQSVTLTITNVKNGSVTFQQTNALMSSPFVTFDWILPAQGDYSLRAQLTQKDATQASSDEIGVFVKDVADTSGLNLTL